ncbi:relaxase/mobilization nuclease domain-containing protein [Nesterenkonia sp. Act20]|uniref:relaxase/mobilization nuclease domain-containing protein n=1 Tax=Nesterenkonia sp. Act20 TaxID=1483432 RepID=UPI001C46521E
MAISAINATVPRFEQQLQEIRLAHGKDGLRPRQAVDEDGKTLRDKNGDPVIARDRWGEAVYEAKYIQAYSAVQSFGREELDPDDPSSWTRANELGRAFAHDRAPGHPALIATEISGRSGMVHNHIIFGAVHPETGKSIDSNVFTPSRMIVAHDRVLAEQGFEQPAFMRQIAMAVEAEMAMRRWQIEDAAPAGLSPSQLGRRISAAESSVKVRHHVDHAGRQTPEQVREARQQREYERYELNEATRSGALAIGVTPPKERFCELELESRVVNSFNDPRSIGWAELSTVGRERGVTISRRGEDVTYGMMLADSNGELQEPARAHRRRGTKLGEGYRVEDVESSLERNRLLNLQREKRQSLRAVQPELIQLGVAEGPVFEDPRREHAQESTHSKSRGETPAKGTERVGDQHDLSATPTAAQGADQGRGRHRQEPRRGAVRTNPHGAHEGLRVPEIEQEDLLVAPELADGPNASLRRSREVHQARRGRDQELAEARREAAAARRRTLAERVAEIDRNGKDRQSGHGFS